MPNERFLIIQLHEVLSFLGQQGVASILTNAQMGLVGHMTSEIDASYLADSVVLTRYFELEGEVRMAISVLKKRGGRHERSIRELTMHDGAIQVGEPLRDYSGVLTGVPVRSARFGRHATDPPTPSSSDAFTPPEKPPS
jgi:circadian clock protein KaiC